MKHTNKYLAVLMAISILLCSVIAITSSAADSSQGESETEIEELQPVMATGCENNRFNYDGDKSEAYALKRHWTTNMINSAIENGVMGYSTNKANGALCSVYCYPGTSYYVVIQDNTLALVQCSMYGDDAWAPDNTIVWY